MQCVGNVNPTQVRVLAIPRDFRTQLSRLPAVPNKDCASFLAIKRLGTTEFQMGRPDVSHSVELKQTTQ